MLNTVWYFPLENVKSRYTEQLSQKWMPAAFDEVLQDNYSFKFEPVSSGEWDRSDIKVGQVLDATGRGLFSLYQVSKFLALIEQNKVVSGDVLFYQDYWTPGIEAIYYALHLYGIKGIRTYSMLHAQTVDIYDFVYPMRDWMRYIELGYDAVHTGIFVASTIHKQQLRDAKFKAPIHVVGLPIQYTEVQERLPLVEKKNQVIYCSRLDSEKQPQFMLKVASEFLKQHQDWKWIVTTSRDAIASNIKGFANDLLMFAQKNDRFDVKVGLSKNEYYECLAASKILFNSSLQDYVSWTLLEGAIAGCDLVFPRYRSFPECVPNDRLYLAFELKSALELFDLVIASPKVHYDIARKADKGRVLEAEIVVKGSSSERNIWTQS